MHTMARRAGMTRQTVYFCLELKMWSSTLEAKRSFVRNDSVRKSYCITTVWLQRRIMSTRSATWQVYIISDAAWNSPMRMPLYFYLTPADQGTAFAQYAAGWMYEHGEGVAQVLQTAVRYYQMAANQEFQDAIDQLNEFQ